MIMITFLTMLQAQYVVVIIEMKQKYDILTKKYEEMKKKTEIIVNSC